MTQDIRNTIGTRKANRKAIGNRKIPFEKTTRTRSLKTGTSAKTEQTKTTDHQTEALPQPTSDYRKPGRLLGWHTSWPAGWSRRVVKEGLRWSWKGGKPPRLKEPINIRKTKESIDVKVQDLLNKDVIEPAPGKVFMNHLFEVPKRESEEMRLVLDASKLNEHIQAFKFRMVSKELVRLSLTGDAYLASIDLKDAYWHIPIHKRFRNFLSFAAKNRVFRFKVLPFGLNLAPRVFTKMMKPVQKKLQKLGIKVIMYLDDWLIIANTREECAQMVKKTLEVGRSMGLLFNLKKSHLTPTTLLDWLGLTWNTVTETVSLSEQNQVRCLKKLRMAICSKDYSRRQWESLVGSLNHAAEVVPYGRLRLRRLLVEGRNVFNSHDRDRTIPFPPSLQRRLKWWTSAKLSSSSKWTPAPPDMTITTDASDWGWGFQSSLGHQGAGPWSQNEKLSHINIRELKVVLLALQQEENIENRSIKILSDNSATVYCINRQGSSRSRALLRICEELFKLARTKNVQLSASYLPGNQNTWTDSLSRKATSTIDWSLKQEEFDLLTRRYGQPQIDLFASNNNAKCRKFLSLVTKTAEGGPDALTENWNRWQYVYLFPPPNTKLMMKVIYRLRAFQGQVLMITPLWEAQPWVHDLLQWCPNPHPLAREALEERIPEEMWKSLRLHVWSFSVGRY